MEPPVRRPSPTSALGGLALLQRYSLDLSRVADSVTAEGGARDLDVRLLTTIHRLGGASPSDVAASTRRPRSTVSRSIARAIDQGLIERAVNDRDHRRAELRLTPLGAERVDAFASALGNFFMRSGALVEHIMVLLARAAEADHRSSLTPLEVAALLGDAGARFVTEVTPVMRRHGVTEAVDRHALVLIADRGQLRPAQLADELRLTAAGTSSLLERLEGRGLLVRESGTVVGDGRGVLVRLTPAGTEAVNGVIQVFLRHRDALTDALEQTLAVRVPVDA
jgi:DNA-binding MarR family transcriptional regulator